jgi:phosphoribosylaminoimidazole-succinocarboxamide synthase
MEKHNELYSGKAKSVYSTDDPNLLIMHFRDDASAFNGEKLAVLAGKGRVNNLINAHIMTLLAKQGVPTHFVRTLSAEESLVKRLEMIPIECVIRNYVAGGLARRLGLTEGLSLEPPIFEFFLKNDALGDPMVNESHIRTFAYANETQMAQMKDLTIKVNDILKPIFLQAGLLLVDYKLEFGMFEGQVTLGDEFSPDGCRLWDAETLEKMDKDRFRRDLGGTVEAYLQVARRLGIVIPN